MMTSPIDAIVIVALITTVVCQAIALGRKREPMSIDDLNVAKAKALTDATATAAAFNAALNAGSTATAEAAAIDSATAGFQQISTTLEPFLTPGMPVVSVAADSPGTGTVTITWPGVPNATTYNVLRGTVAADPAATLIADAVSPLVNSGLVSGSSYFYRVQAVGPTGIAVDSADAEIVAP